MKNQNDSKGNNGQNGSADSGDRGSAANNISREQSSRAAPPPAAVVQAPPRAKTGFANFMSFVAFVAAGTLGAGAYLFWEEYNKDQEMVSKSFSEIQTGVEDKLASTQANLINSVNSTLSVAQSQLKDDALSIQKEVSKQLVEQASQMGATKALIAKTSERQDAVEISLNRLYNRIGDSSREWMVSEAEYLLQVANHRLILEDDVKTAIAALKLADSRIVSAGDPALLKVREVLAKEITALETLPQPDVAGTALALVEIAKKFESLPLKARIQPEATGDAPSAESPITSDTWGGVPAAMLNAVKGLVTVRYNDRPLEPLLAPKQVRHLHDNLQLKLEQARLAILHKNAGLYQANIDMAIEWVNSYFDTDSDETQRVIAKLSDLRGARLEIDKPDISSSLRTLKLVATKLELGLAANQPDTSSTEVATLEGGE